MCVTDISFPMFTIQLVDEAEVEVSDSQANKKASPGMTSIQSFYFCKVVIIITFGMAKQRLPIVSICVLMHKMTYKISNSLNSLYP